MGQTTDELRRGSATERRRNVIRALSEQFDASAMDSALNQLRRLLDAEHERPMIISGDIDGLVSASMLHSVMPGWQVGAIVMKSGSVLTNEEALNGRGLEECFGVDIFSTYIPNVSNHVALWGDKRLGGSEEAGALAREYDREVKDRARRCLMASPSLWAGIEAATPGSRSTSAQYRYPLGTAHVLLAMLEALGRAPRFFDREYLPWLVANCDGGLKTIRDYPYNVPMWWSALAAVVGPASMSEQLYRLASTQRPTEFAEVVSRLRSEGAFEPGYPAAHLDENWNLDGTIAGFAAVSEWIDGLSGWGDPFAGGRESLPSWPTEQPLDRGRLQTSGRAIDLDEVKRHFRLSLASVHTNFASFDGKRRLNWVSAWPSAPAREDAPPPALR